MRRAYKNGPEEAFAQLAERNGWTVTKRGWPDFFCIGPDGEVIVVEVKPSFAQGLRRDQCATMEFLKSVGVKCYVSDGNSLEPYTNKFAVQRRVNRAKRIRAWKDRQVV